MVNAELGSCRNRAETGRRQASKPPFEPVVAGPAVTTSVDSLAATMEDERLRARRHQESRSGSTLDRHGLQEVGFETCQMSPP